MTYLAPKWLKNGPKIWKNDQKCTFFSNFEVTDLVLGGMYVDTLKYPILKDFINF